MNGVSRSGREWVLLAGFYCIYFSQVSTGRAADRADAGECEVYCGKSDSRKFDGRIWISNSEITDGDTLNIYLILSY